MTFIDILSYIDNSEPIFKDLQILSLPKINEYLTGLFMVRYFYLQNLPEIFENYFVSNKEIHNYNTRSSSLLHKISNKTNYRAHTLCKQRNFSMEQSSKSI